LTVTAENNIYSASLIINIMYQMLSIFVQLELSCFIQNKVVDSYFLLWTLPATWSKHKNN